MSCGLVRVEVSAEKPKCATPKVLQSSGHLERHQQRGQLPVRRGVSQVAADSSSRAVRELSQNLLSFSLELDFIGDCIYF